jgi:hypothetical protein
MLTSEVANFKKDKINEGWLALAQICSKSKAVSAYRSANHQTFIDRFSDQHHHKQMFEQCSKEAMNNC